jgi:hypothetical protein
MNGIQQLLDGISIACLEINQVLQEHLEKTTNDQYKLDIEKDIITLGNLRLIMSAVKEDVRTDKVGASSELLLRIAANEFKNKLVQIPEKKSVQKEIVKSLKEVHGLILKRINR